MVLLNPNLGKSDRFSYLEHHTFANHSPLLQYSLNLSTLSTDHTQDIVSMKGLFCIKYITILNDNCKKKYGRWLFVLSLHTAYYERKQPRRELASEKQQRVHETDKHKAFMTSPEAGADLPLMCFSFSKAHNPETWPITCLTVTWCI